MNKHFPYRNSRLEVFCKKPFLEFSQNPEENSCARATLKLKALGLQLY